MSGLELTYNYTDNGFCRVMYKAFGKLGKVQFHYCLMLEYGTEYALYRCTGSEGEPEYQISMDNIKTVELPNCGSETGLEVVDFLKRQIPDNIVERKV